MNKFGATNTKVGTGSRSGSKCLEVSRSLQGDTVRVMCVYGVGHLVYWMRDIGSFAVLLILHVSYLILTAQRIGEEPGHLLPKLGSHITWGGG